MKNKSKRYDVSTLLEAAYEKASLWYGHYKTMIDGLIGRSLYRVGQGK